MNQQLNNDHYEIHCFFDDFNLFENEIRDLEASKECFISLLEEETLQNATLTEIYGIKIESLGTDDLTQIEAPTPCSNLEENLKSFEAGVTADKSKKQTKGRPRINLDCSVNDLFLHLCSFVSSQISKILSST